MSLGAPRKRRQNALTSIGDAYTVAATHEGGDGEVNGIVVRHFLVTLAEIALAVAARQARQETER